jgi:isopentenyl-diphosphate Delta-isomerase
VQLVDPTGAQSGTCTVAEAHEPPGRLHQAFSVLLQDAAGRLLLQRRAAVKSRFPLRWSNTCCGHPEPGGDLIGCASVRLTEELGVSGVGLVEVGAFRYRAEDPGSGFVEHEHDHVLLGTIGTIRLRPDPAEVAQYQWIAPDVLCRQLTRQPQRYTPWLAGVLRVAAVGADWGRGVPTT